MNAMHGKNVLVTGASRGLGEWTARRFAEAGARIILVARDSGRLAEVTSAITSGGGHADYLVGDVSRRAFWSEAFKHVDDRYGTIDVLVNNAGIGVFGRLEELTEAALDGMMRVNFYACVFSTQEALARMKARRRGHIINVVSTAGKVGRASEAGYVASKWALAGFTESLRLEAKPHGIRVTAFCPGGMKTSFWDTETGRTHQPNRQAFLEPHLVADMLLQVAASPDELAIDDIVIRRA